MVNMKFIGEKNWYDQLLGDASLFNFLSTHSFPETGMSLLTYSQTILNMYQIEEISERLIAEIETYIHHFDLETKTHSK